MKKKVLLLLALMFVFLLGAAGCGYEHEYDNVHYNESKHWFTCICGSEKKPVAHSGGVATCTKKAICEGCGQPYGEKLEHDYSIFKSSNEKHWYECECGAKQEVNTHDYTIVKYDEEKHWFECSCGKAQPASEHTGGTYTCQEQAICETCNQAYGELACNYQDGTCIGCGDILGMVYKLSEDGTYYSISEYTGTTKNLVIPSTYQGLPVKAINSFVFDGCESLESVILPNTITGIKMGTFRNCINLKSIVIPESVTAIGSFSFDGCTSLESITIPSGVTGFYLGTFSNCKNLTEFKFNGTVEQWGNVEKSFAWISSVPAQKVICTDGEASLN